MDYNIKTDSIPGIDIRYYFKQFLESLVDKIPHHPKEFSRDVEKYIESVYGALNSKVNVPTVIGSIGYNADTQKVFIDAHSTSIRNEKIYLPVENVLPIVFQMIIMIPWDFIGEGEEALGGVMGVDEPPGPDEIIQWLFDILREELSKLGIPIPPINGDFSTDNPSFGNNPGGFALRTLIYNIPVMDISQSLYENLMNSIDNTFSDLVIPYKKQILGGGVSLKYKYLVDDVEYENLPGTSVLDGKLFKIIAKSYDKDGIVAEQTIFEKQINPSSCSILFEADSEGYDDSVQVGMFVMVKNGSDSITGKIEEIIDGDDNTKQKMIVFVENDGNETITILSNSNTLTCEESIYDVSVVYVANDAGEINGINENISYTVDDIKFTVTEIIQDGVIDESKKIYGFNIKSRCRIKGVLSNISNSPINYNDFKTITINDNVFNLETNVYQVFPSTFNKVYAFSAFIGYHDYSILYTKLEDVIIRASVTITQAGILARWVNLEDIKYVGQFFSLGSQNFMGDPQYIRVQFSSERKGEDVVVDTPVATLLPEGLSHIASLWYDPSKREVELWVDGYTETITFKTNEVIWFLINLLLLIPVSIV